MSQAASALRKACPEVEEVLLVGSLARGDFTGTSDADVLLVLHDTRLNPVERIRRYLPFFHLEVGVDLIPLTRRELTSLGGGPSQAPRLLEGSVPLA